jgi:hypothetical protein
MKRLIIPLLVIVALVSLAFTWEGELDPNSLVQWRIVEGSGGLTESGLYQLLLQNPDRESAIKTVQVYLNPLTKNLLIYRYFKDGDIYIYYFDGTQDKFLRYELPAEKRTGCMKCHKDQLIDKRML